MEIAAAASAAAAVVLCTYTHERTIATGQRQDAIRYYKTFNTFILYFYELYSRAC